MKLRKRRIQSFQNLVFSWWEDNKRDLPWRRTHDPYKILVSEVMLQQTQVDRVLPKYDEFLYFFPDVYTLSQATPAKVLRVWRGMGYNRRALYLQKAAKAIVELHHGYFPEDEAHLTKLPGVGTYTARALLVFAFNHPIAVVDTNIRKIITHFFFDDKPQKEMVIEDVARQLLPKKQAWKWNQALMDYGALALNVSRITYHVSPKAKPFKDSNRFYRGRIVDRLRESDMKETELLKELIVKHKKSKNLLKKIIESLERDGLITRTKENMLRLPT